MNAYHLATHNNRKIANRAFSFYIQHLEFGYDYANESLRSAKTQQDNIKDKNNENYRAWDLRIINLNKMLCFITAEFKALQPENNHSRNRLNKAREPSMV